MLSFKIKMSKTFLIDPQPEECSQYVIKTWANLCLDVVIKKVLIEKKSVSSHY